MYALVRIFFCLLIYLFQEAVGKAVVIEGRGNYCRLSGGVTGDPGSSEAAADEVNKHAGGGEEISEEEVERFILE